MVQALAPATDRDVPHPAIVAQPSSPRLIASPRRA
jgi:hypothetical protein